MKIYINQETKERFFAHEFQELDGHVKIIDEIIEPQGTTCYFTNTDTDAEKTQKAILKRERWQKPKLIKKEVEQ